MNLRRRSTLALAAVIASTAVLTGCSTDADVVKRPAS